MSDDAGAVLAGTLVRVYDIGRRLARGVVRAVFAVQSERRIRKR